MDTKFLERVVSTVESHLELSASPVDFEMAYQARVAIDRIRFAIKETEQFANCSPQVSESRFQLLDALDRLESIERKFQKRSKDVVQQITTSATEGVRRSANGRTTA